MGIERLLKAHQPDWPSLYEQLQAAVVAGDHAVCREIFKTHNPQKLPREWACRFAELAVRTHMPLFALRALHTFVFPENTFSNPATNSEKMTYARSLYHLGAVTDSIHILSSISPKDEPEVYFLRACAHIFGWNYAAAITDLKAYLDSDKIAPYRRLVGKVNLAASYLNLGAWIETENLLNEIQAECEAGSFQLLLGNSFELRSQVELSQGHYDKALQSLEKASKILKTQGALYLLYVEKWKAVCYCLQNPTPENLKLLDDIRRKADEMGHWNTLRECDLFEALATHNEDLIRKVIMGTPAEFYRQRARKLFKTDIIFRGQYIWKIKGENPELPEQTFNPYRKTSSTTAALYETPMLMNLFEALASDFYQPSNISSLFKKTYPTEKFNPFSSPARVLQLMRRLDSWFQKNNLPLRVRFKKSEFCLKAISNVNVIIERGKDKEQLSPKKRQLADLRLILKEKSLSVENICQVLNISESSVRRLLKQGLTDGQIKKVGSGRGTLYQAAKARQKRESA